MKIEIHWPDMNNTVKVIELVNYYEKFHSVLLMDFITLSHKYDIIIDCGKVTFVDKE